MSRVIIQFFYKHNFSINIVFPYNKYDQQCNINIMDKRNNQKNKLSKKEKKLLKGAEKLKQKELEEQQQKQVQLLKNSQSKKNVKKDIVEAQNTKKEKEKKQQKPRQVQAESQEAEGGQDELDFNNLLGNEEIGEIENQEVSFLISEINEKHYHSMKIILEKFARTSGITSSEWADAIISNAKAGNVAVIDDDSEDEDQDQNQDQEQEQANEVDDEEDVVNSVLNLLPSAHKLTKKIREKVAQSYQKWGKKNSALQNSLRQSSSSLLICQRAINLPAFVSVSQHQVLAGELKESLKANQQNFNKLYGKYILSVSQIQMPKGVKNPSKQEIIYSRFEDYKFIEKSQEWWIGENSPNALKKVEVRKLYIIISVKNYLQAAESFSELLGEGEV